MTEKHSYEELEQRIQELEQTVFNLKRSEKALRESERGYRKIYDNAQVGLYRVRLRDVKIESANDRMAEMFGYSTQLRSITQGRGTYSVEFSEYKDVPQQISQKIIAKVYGK